MIFLIPLIVIVGVVFSIDYIYFREQNEQIIVKKKQQDLNSSLEQERKQYLQKLFKIE